MQCENDENRHNFTHLDHYRSIQWENHADAGAKEKGHKQYMEQKHRLHADSDNDTIGWRMTTEELHHLGTLINARLDAMLDEKLEPIRNDLQEVRAGQQKLENTINEQASKSLRLSSIPQMRFYSSKTRELATLRSR
jgi:hypothetical protein